MSLGPDILLDDATNDLDLSRGGDLTLTPDVAQAIRIRLKFFRGEWFLDREQGVPWFEQIFVKNPNLEHVRAIFRKVIVDTPGVGDVRTVEVTYDPLTRGLSLEFEADSDYGEISAVEEIAV